MIQIILIVWFGLVVLAFICLLFLIRLTIADEADQATEGPGRSIIPRRITTEDWLRQFGVPLAVWRHLPRERLN